MEAGKVRSGIVPLAKRKMAIMAHTETVVHRSKIVHKTKVPAPPQDLGNKTESTHRVGRTRSLRTPKDLGYPLRPHLRLPARRPRLVTRVRFEEMATLSSYSRSQCLILTFYQERLLSIHKNTHSPVVTS